MSEKRNRFRKMMDSFRRMLRASESPADGKNRFAHYIWKRAQSRREDRAQDTRSDEKK